MNNQSIIMQSFACLLAFDSYLQNERPHHSHTQPKKKKKKKKKGFELWIVMYLLRLLTQCFIVVMESRVPLDQR